MTDQPSQGDDPTRLPLASPDVNESRIESLRQLFPEAFAEGKLDMSRLSAALGDVAEGQRERYGLSWAGKADAIRSIQSRSIGTLKPDRGRSINFDTTGNLFIEGDNLEVLKLLQRSYHGRVKMIYIDPPYNTGKEFIYPDNFAEGLRHYLEFSKQVGEGGARMTSNADTDGRYHSKWLSMMYPRLFIARQLLRDDGVIFISIDDNEVHNLRMVMNEIFGEENFVATVIWHKMDSPKNSAQHLSEDHEYIVIYARDLEVWSPNSLPRTEEMLARYKNPDNDPRGRWLLSDLAARNFYAQGRYAITTPSGKVIPGPPAGSYWRVSEKKFWELDRDNRIWWGSNGGNRPGIKRFLTEVRDGVVPQTYWAWKDVGSTRNAKQELSQVMAANVADDLFITPKPTRLIRRMMDIAADPDSVVLDFFAGSGTTGEAVMRQNAADGGNRKFILVQLPETTGSAHFKTIVEQSVERLRRAGAAIVVEDNEKLARKDGGSNDYGFKVFRLDASNFKVWDALEAGARSQIGVESLIEYMQEHIQNIIPGSKDEDILFEIMLKSGVDLNATRETVSVTGKDVYLIDGGTLAVCLSLGVSLETMRGIIALGPKRVICLDRCFNGKDSLKTNTVLEMKSHNIQFQTA